MTCFAIHLLIRIRGHILVLIKLFAIVVASLALTLNALAGGTVQFRNNPSTSIRIYNFVTLTTAPAQPIDDLVIGLFWGSTAGSATNLVATASIGGFPPGGTFLGNTELQIPGTNPGDTGYAQVAAWYASYGDTVAGMDACIDAGVYWGSSESPAYGVFGPGLEVTLGGAGFPPSEPAVLFNFSTFNEFLPGFTVTGTPEPGTISLAGLGVVALLLFRPRK